MTKSPLTQDQFSRLEGELTKLQDLNLQQNKLLENFKRCYALAYLAGVHPDELAGRVKHRIDYGQDHVLRTPMYRWRYARLVIHVYPTSDPSANTAAKRLGAVPEIIVPIKDVPHCLWDEKDLKAYLTLQASRAKKERTDGNQ